MFDDDTTPEMIAYTQGHILRKVRDDPAYHKLDDLTQDALEECLAEMRLDANALSDHDRRQSMQWLLRHNILIGRRVV